MSKKKKLSLLDKAFRVAVFGFTLGVCALIYDMNTDEKEAKNDSTPPVSEASSSSPFFVQP